MKILQDTFKGKTVFISGHTGFKGSWLSIWLNLLGAKVIGCSIDIPTDPSNFVASDMRSFIDDNRLDIRDVQGVKMLLKDCRPDFIFHLAAQSLVRPSYESPLDTLTTNAIGSANILDSLTALDRDIIAIMITSDKAYDNVEWEWGYKETDALGGKDIYSGSKGAAELVIKSYFHSFIERNSKIKLGVARAGNVIGGGDWAKDRIVVDCIKSWSNKEKVTIRSPNATRPWQHVLEPLSGYLRLGEMLNLSSNFNGLAFNFGPKADQNRTVLDLIKDLSLRWGFDSQEEALIVNLDSKFEESGLLKLNIDRALFYLKWEPNLTYEETVNYVSDWYSDFYLHNKDMHISTKNQIDAYESIAKERNRIWT